MKAAAIAMMLAAVSSTADAQVDAKLTVNVYDQRRADIALSLYNKTGRDLCFFKSLVTPELHAVDGSKIANGPAWAGVEIPIWTRPNNVDVVWRYSDEQVIRFDIGERAFEYRSDPLDKLSDVSLDITLYDCIDFHHHRLGYPIDEKIKHVTLHVVGHARFDHFFKPAPSQP